MPFFTVVFSSYGGNLWDDGEHGIGEDREGRVHDLMLGIILAFIWND
jgi:hypothetical protein